MANPRYAYQRQWREDNKERIKIQKAAAYQENKAEVRRERKAYMESDNGKYIIYIQKIKYAYGLSEVSLRDMMDKQRGCCAICLRSLDHLKTTFNVDHCHTTGKVRGLLCTNCNLMLGKAEDNTVTLRRAADYLEI